jgi:hypothetical protein
MSIEQRQTYSKYLIWLGLLAWIPYILMRALRLEVVVMPFLVVHLTGVLGGAFLQRASSGEQNTVSERERFRKTFSTVVILLGVSVWGVYFGLEWITGVEREVAPFLIAHLSGVLSGAGIKVYNFLSRK